MNRPESGNQEGNIASPLASVAGNTQDVHILMIGAGRGASALMEVFPRYDWLHLDAIVDVNPHAPAFTLAEARDIPCLTDVEQALDGFHGDLVVDVTGDPAMDTCLKEWSSRMHIEVLSGKSARLLFNMSHHQISDRKTIHVQNSHMLLLDSLLEISTELSCRSPLSSIAERTLAGVYKPAMAIKGLALMLNDRDMAEVVGAVGIKKPVSEISVQSLQDICTGLSTDTPFKLLSKPLRVDIHTGQMPFNLVLPFWQNKLLSGMLLFAIPGEIESEQVRVLEIASTHLRIITTTLDQYQKLENLAALDPLTGIYNRRMFEESLQQEVSRCRRNRDGHLGCVFIDVDDFKSVNDRYGHLAGDKTLKHVVACIRQCIRESDTLARYGGDEFVLLLPSNHSDDVAHIHHIGERILQQITTTHTPDYPDISVSVSIGIATQSSSTVDAETLLAQADKAACQAKNSGKGKIKNVVSPDCE